MPYVSGSSADGLFIGNGDSLDVVSGGDVTDTTITGTGTGEIGEGGSAEDSFVTASGYLSVGSGGTTADTNVGAGGTEEIDGGVASFATISTGGTQTIYSGTAEDSQVAGGTQYVLGGVVQGAEITAGGIQVAGLTTIIVTSGAAEINGTTVGSGGTEVLVSQGPVTSLTSNGVPLGLLTSSGGVVTLSYGNVSGGLAGYSIQDVQDGGEIYISEIAPDGTVVDTASNTGYISLPAQVTDTTVLSGGTLQFEGGMAVGLTAESGATELIGGTFTLSNVIVSTGAITVSNNVVGDGVTEVIEANGITVSSVIQNGGIEYVSSGGVASGSTVRSGGFLYVESGGTVSGGVISAGGVEYIEPGATASDVQVLSGGTQYDLNGGSDDNTMIDAGGTLYVSSGGGEGNVTDAGTEVILPGGSGGGIKIDNSGVLSFSDSTATGANTVYAGGVTVFTGGATAGTAGFDVFASTPQIVSSARTVQSGFSTTLPRFEAATFAAASAGAVLFQDSSTAGGATINVSSGGAAWFEDASTAGSATIAVTSGAFAFTNQTTAGGAAISVNGAGAGIFVDSSTAGSATIMLNATASSGGVLLFANAATAGSATIDNVPVNGDVGGLIAFASGTTAGGATINNQARTTTDLSRAIDQIIADVVSSGTTPKVAAYRAEQAVAAFPGQSSAPIGGLLFFDGSSPGSATINNTQDGLTDFFDNATADASPTITNSGTQDETVAPSTVFYSATAGAATIINEIGGATAFAYGARGGTAHITDESGGALVLGDGADLGQAQIDNQAGAVIIALGGTVGTATITDAGVMVFGGDSTLGSGTVTLTSGAVLGFVGRGDGGSAQVTTTDASVQIDASAASEAVNIGSIAGPGTFALGGNTLKVGGANLDSTVTGTVTNGGIVNSANGLRFTDVPNVGGEATLDKVGTGTLTLSGTVNQTNLAVEKGSLVVAGPITGSSTATISATGTLELGGASAENVTFAAGATGSLVLDQPQDYTGIVGGLAIAQTLVLSALALPGATASVVASGGAATIAVNDGGQLFTIALADASLAGLALTAGATSAGLLAVTLSAQVVSTAIAVGSGETLSNLVIVSGGSVSVQDGGTISNVVVNSGGSVTFDEGATGIRNQVNDGGIETIDDGATVNGIRVNDPGELAVSSGGTASATQIIGGREDVYGLAVSDTVASGGIQAVQSGGVATATQIDPGGTFLLAGGAASDIVLSIGGAVDFTALAFATGASAFVDPNTDLLTVSAGGMQASLQLAGDYASDLFQVAGDGAGGTLVSAEGVACYCPGTLILTNRGDMPVEILAIGDSVLTADGRIKTVRWIGRRSYAGRFLAANPNVQPIRFRAGSLGDGLPRRDLLVSPEHAMFLDGLLVPARCLVNGSTIIRANVEQVDYVHVELDTHDVILAEGAPSESFMDDESRGMFHNAHEFATLYPDAGDPGQFCGPKVTDGYELEAIRRRLAMVAGKMAAA